MKNLMPWELLARYFSDEIENEEKLLMESWINEDPEREKKIEELREIWEQSRISATKLDTEEAWNRLAADMDKLENGSEQISRVLNDTRPTYLLTKKRQHNGTGVGVRNMIMFAAAAAVLVAAAVFTYSNYHTIIQKSADASQEIAKREITAKEGERATYILSDGSRIILHAGSRLEVPLSFNSSKRELFLEGEAYFEVTHDSEKPFIVHSEEAFTRVLGTKFLVRAWPDEQNRVEVVVSEGEVALGRARQASEGITKTNEAIITRNQIGNIREGRAPEVMDKVDLEWYMGWTRGKLTFKNRPLHEIIPKLEKWYVIEIQTENRKVANKRLTAEIDYSHSMSEVLKGIALSLDLQMEKEGRSVMFRMASK